MSAHCHWGNEAGALNNPGRPAGVGPTARPPDELFNRNGARMCDALGCRRHARLMRAHNGLFCQRHAAVASYLRARIKPHRGDADEAEARVAEVVFRKRPDAGHVHYAVRLSTRAGLVDSFQPRLAKRPAARSDDRPCARVDDDKEGAIAATKVARGITVAAANGASALPCGRCDNTSALAVGTCLDSQPNTARSSAPPSCPNRCAVVTVANVNVGHAPLGSCRAPGCVEAPRVYVGGYGTFCRGHGRALSLARTRAAALVGRVPFACIAPVVVGVDERTRLADDPT